MLEASFVIIITQRVQIWARRDHVLLLRRRWANRAVRYSVVKFVFLRDPCFSCIVP